ncbi:uncharacterized protein LOC111262480 [Varroa jacobsoni]|uniref:uncharacterized protein LOC111262480 n=1 Tax=Varroa jacobsoni TaxID=62625 RepID=UPI000BFA0E44|nr:uncharacterized protein LOC111262480 [Varroa jacobsoni]
MPSEQEEQKGKKDGESIVEKGSKSLNEDRKSLQGESAKAVNESTRPSRESLSQTPADKVTESAGKSFGKVPGKGSGIGFRKGAGTDLQKGARTHIQKSAEIDFQRGAGTDFRKSAGADFRESAGKNCRKSITKNSGEAAVSVPRGTDRIADDSSGTPGSSPRKSNEFSVKNIPTPKTRPSEESDVQCSCLSDPCRIARERESGLQNCDEPSNSLEFAIPRKGPLCWFIMMVAILSAITLIYQAGPGSLRFDEDEVIRHPDFETSANPRNSTSTNSTSLFSRVAKLNPERTLHHIVKRVPGEDISLISPLDVRENRTVEFACNHRLRVIHDHLVEINASLLPGLDQLRREYWKLRFKMEANVSFPKYILEHSKQMNIAVVFCALPRNLTFSYNFVNCSNQLQPIRVIYNPLARRVLDEFRQSLVDNPVQGEIIDRFRCIATASPQLPDMVQLISFRILADMNFADREFTLYTCATSTRICTAAYRSTLPIEAKMDINNLRTQFLVARRNATKKMNWRQNSQVSISTWCETDFHE